MTSIMCDIYQIIVVQAKSMTTVTNKSTHNEKDHWMNLNINHIKTSVNG